jgi:hypothetical protein
MRPARLMWILLALVLLFPSVTLAKGGGRGGKGGPVTVKPYTRKDGTHVEGHHRSAPDRSKSNNWSSKGNVNPFTGKPGTNKP